MKPTTEDALLRLAQTCEAEALRIRKVMDTLADRLNGFAGLKDHEEGDAELITTTETYIRAGHDLAAQLTAIGLKARGQSHYVI